MKSSRTIRRERAAARRLRVPRHSRPLPPVPEWLEDASGQCARATAIGSRSLLVENHTGILGFSDRDIRLATRSGPLCVRGVCLALRDVRPGTLTIFGEIHSIDLPCPGGEAPDEG